MSEIEALRTIVATGTPAGIRAENVITLNTGEEFVHGVLLPEGDTIGFSFKTSDIIVVTEENPVRVYPVPANQSVHFDVLVSAENAELMLTDINGAVLEHVKLKAGSNRFEYNTNKLPQGVYIYRLKQSDAKTSNGKFVINR